MNHNSRTLLSVLLIALFSLVTLRGITLILNDGAILGDTTGTGSTVPPVTPKCSDLKGTCAQNCPTGYKPVTATGCSTQVCCVQITLPTPTVKKNPLGNVPCDEIEKIQRQYCTGVTPTSHLISVTPTINTCKTNGERRCRQKTIEVCLNNIWKAGETCETACYEGRCVSNSPTPSQRPSSSPTPRP